MAEAGNYAAVQRMLQTSPYWLSQYGNVATAALAAAAATNPTLSGAGATPFDIYYRQAAAALQQKHQNTSPIISSTGPIPGSPTTPTTGTAMNTNQMLPQNANTPLYVPSSAVGRFNPLYLNSLPPSTAASLLGAHGDDNLLMSLGHTPSYKSDKDTMCKESNKTKASPPPGTPDGAKTNHSISSDSNTANGPMFGGLEQSTP